MKNCVLNIDGQFAIEIFSVAEIFRCMYGGKGIPQKAKFMQALSTKRLDTNTRSTTNFRFNVHVWKKLSRIEVDSKTTPRVFQSFQLLEQCGSDDARRRLDERRNGQETDENYMLATLFAETNKSLMQTVIHSAACYHFVSFFLFEFISPHGKTVLICKVQ